MKEDVAIWLQAGADLAQGVRLFFRYSQNEPFKQLLRRDAVLVRQHLFNELVRLSCIAIDDAILAHRDKLIEDSLLTFRKTWSFLGDSDCPCELKILAADKITAYNNYCAARAALFMCTTPEECFVVAQKTVSNFIENDQITNEFVYYKEHHNVLGKHSIFARSQMIAMIKKEGPIKLVQRRENLTHNIWRIKSQISNNDRPDLLIQREKRLIDKEVELSEVEKLIEAYAVV